MLYFTDIVTRGYEADLTRRVPLPALFQYLEHLRWCSIIDPRSGLGSLVDVGYFFVVHQQRMVVRRAVGQDTPLRAYLWAEKVGRSSIDIGHEIRRLHDDAIVAEAHVTGLWLGPDRRLARIPDALREFAGTLEPPAPVGDGHARSTDARLESSYIRPPDVPFPHRSIDIAAPADDLPEPSFAYQTRVRPSDLDIFAHVNAATYLRFCDDARIDGSAYFACETRRPTLRAAIRYVKETVEGETLTIRVWRVDAETFAFTVRADGELRATAAMELAPQHALPRPTP